MKRLLLLSLLTISPFFQSFAQKADLETVQSFWNSNIAAMISLDKETIISQTNFPLLGSWGYVIELDGDADSWTKEDFVQNIDKIFNDDLRVKLRRMDHNQLVHHLDENGQLNFILQLLFITEEEGVKYESATLLYFKQFDGIWKLYQIEYAG
jgi:hypothetical protein